MLQDAQRTGVSVVDVQQNQADGALVLITGHDEEEDDERRQAQKKNHSSQREPVHLPDEVIKESSISCKLSRFYLTHVHYSTPEAERVAPKLNTGRLEMLETLRSVICSINL